MDNRWRYAIGTLAIPFVIGGIQVLNSHPVLAYILFGFAGISIVWGIWPIFFGTKQKLSRQKIAELKQVPNTLTLMHQRIKLLRDKLATKDIGRENAARLQEKMHKLFRFGDTIMRRIHQWQESGDPRFIRSVELYNRLFIGSVYGSRYVNFMCDTGGMLETEDVGLQPVLKTDHEYKQLKDKLDMQYAGTSKKIRKSILKYERYLYGFSSVVLWNDYRIKYLGKQLPTVVEARVVQFEGHSEDEIMNKLKEDVVSAINKFLR